MNYSEFLKKREAIKSFDEEVIKNQQKEKRAALYKKLAEVLKDPNTWYDAFRSEDEFNLVISRDKSDELRLIHSKSDISMNNKSYFKYRIYDKDETECLLNIMYPITCNPRLTFNFVVHVSLTEKDYNTIIEKTAQYLDEKADEVLNSLKK